MRNTPNLNLQLPEKTDKVDVDVLSANFEKIDEKVQEVFTNASNGKIKVAEAITGKGIATSPSETFDSMAEKISRLSKVTIDGIQIEGEVNLKLDSFQYKNIINGIGISFESCSVVIFNDEVHVLGGYQTKDRTRHVKWSGGNTLSSWTNVSTLPVNFYNCSAVVYKNEIHILGNSDTYKSHYKWDGVNWVKLADLPFVFYGHCKALDYKNTIYALDDSSGMFVWDEITDKWTLVSSIPSDSSTYIEWGTEFAFVHNSYIYIFKSDMVAIWNGSFWSKTANTGAPIHNGGGISYKGDIYAVSYVDNFYKFNTTTKKWTLVNAMGTDIDYLEQFVYKDKIHFFHGTAGSVLKHSYLAESYIIV